MSDTVIIWPDSHCPYQNKKALGNFFQMLNDAQPERVVQIGDLFDCVPVARWVQGTLEEDGRALQAEIVEGRKMLGQLREAYEGEVVWFEGNHCQRLSKYLRTRAPGLFGLEGLDIPTLFGLYDFDITVTKPPHPVAKNTFAIHGSVVRKGSGASVKAEIQKYGTNVVMGHTHRGGVFYERRGDSQVWGMESGHLADQSQAHYLGPGNRADWHLGFGVLHVDGPMVRPEFIHVEPNGSFLFGGKRYGK